MFSKCRCGNDLTSGDSDGICIACRNKANALSFNQEILPRQEPPFYLVWATLPSTISLKLALMDKVEAVIPLFKSLDDANEFLINNNLDPAKVAILPCAPCTIR